PRAVLADDRHAEGAAAAPSVADERAEETEDRPRRADGERRAEQAREEEARHAARGEDDDDARLAVELLDGGGELAGPQEVEGDVEQPAVEIGGGHHRPPPAPRPRERPGHAA